MANLDLERMFAFAKAGGLQRQQDIADQPKYSDSAIWAQALAPLAEAVAKGIQRNSPEGKRAIALAEATLEGKKAETAETKQKTEAATQAARPREEVLGYPKVEIPQSLTEPQNLQPPQGSLPRNRSHCRAADRP